MDRGGRDEENDTIYPDLTAEGVFDKELILNKDKGFNEFLPEGTTFTPLIPKFIGDFPPAEVKAIPDFPGWIRRKPKGMFYIVSERFKDILQSFTFQECRWHDAHVLFDEKLVPFFVFQLNTNYNEYLINFEKSTFCNIHYRKKIKLNDDHEKVNKFDELYELEKDKGWNSAGFNRAVMKPKFRELDVLFTYHYHLLISERLKNAIEAANITGVKITECPVAFEIAK